MPSSLPPASVHGLRLPASAAMTAFAGGLAAGRGLPTPLGPPATITPTVSMSTSVSGTTPTAIAAVASTVPNTANFAFTGPGAAVCPSITFPYYNQVIRQQPPSQTLGFGAVTVEFQSDAPAISFVHQRNNVGLQRLMVDIRDGRGFIEAYRITNGERAGTAQAGAASTITLDSGSSSSNNYWSNYWVHITGGTGAGQWGQIQSYVGSTKVATMTAAWATAPDGTSTFEIMDTRSIVTNLTNTGATNYYLLASWSGERRMRTYKLECVNQAFQGVYVTAAIDTVIPPPKSTAPKWFWCGDSYSAGTGADLGELNALSHICVDRLGGELINLSIGGTGYLNPNSGSLLSLTARQRLIPPVNAWFVQYNGASAGSFTVTQNGLTASVGYADSASTIQATFNTVFGAGAFTCIAGGAATQKNLWLIGLGANASVSGAMTANFSGMTFSGTSTALIRRYPGELAPNAPLDGAGVPLPFSIVLANGHNDTSDSNAAYTAAAVQAELTTLLNQLTQLYPLADIYVVGNMYVGAYDAAVTACDGAILAACQAALPLINGKLPFIETLTAGLYTATTGHAQAPAGTGTMDLFCWTDAVHPWNTGHHIYGDFIASSIQKIWGI